MWSILSYRVASWQVVDHYYYFIYLILLKCQEFFVNLIWIVCILCLRVWSLSEYWRNGSLFLLGKQRAGSIGETNEGVAGPSYRILFITTWSSTVPTDSSDEDIDSWKKIKITTRQNHISSFQYFISSFSEFLCSSASQTKLNKTLWK